MSRSPRPRRGRGTSWHSARPRSAWESRRGGDGCQRGDVLTELDGDTESLGVLGLLWGKFLDPHDAAAAGQPREGEGAPLGFRDGDRGEDPLVQGKAFRLVGFEVDP